MNDFGEHLPKYLRSLRASALNRSDFTYSDLRPVLVPKKKGHRVICVPTVEDRVLQRSLINYFNDGDKCGLQNRVSFGFLPGRSVKGAARAAVHWRRRKKWAYKTDITKFFDSLNLTTLKDRLSRVVRAKSIHHLLHAAVDCEVRTESERQRSQVAAAGISQGVGVRQGMPLSPFFANVMLKDFDAQIEKSGTIMVRYADDLIVLCESESECFEAHELFVDTLGVLGLEVPPIEDGSKTIIYSPSERADFLGVSLVPHGDGYSLEIVEDQINRIKDSLVSLTDFDVLLRKGFTLSTLLRAIEMRIDGYVSAYEYCSNAEQLQQILERCKDRVISEVFVQLGIDTNALAPLQRRFLGLSVI